MDQNKVDMYIMANANKFPEDRLFYIREQLLLADENKWMFIQTISLNDHVIILILSIFFGYLGVDRFVIGDIGLGIGKLLTGGLCMVWAIVDWFFIMKATKEKNFQNLLLVLNQ